MSGPSERISPEEALIRRAYDAFADRDLDALVAISEETVEVSTVTGLLAGRTEPYRGFEGLAQYLGDLADQWRRLELQPQDFHPLGPDQILVFGRVRAWHKTGTGFIDSQNAWLWTLRANRVVSVRVYADPGEARAAFGRR